MKKILKPLAALVGAVALISATPVIAATIITVDFEAGLPAKGFVHPGANAHLDTEAGHGAVLVIDPIKGASYPWTDFSGLDLIPTRIDDKIVSRYRLQSFDIKSVRNTSLTVDVLPDWVQWLQAGEWTHVELGVGSDDLVRRVFAYGGITVDNLVFEVDENWAVVPEPSTWAMMILGFGLVGSTLRGRRSSRATA